MLFRAKRHVVTALLMADLLAVVAILLGFRGPLQPPTVGAVLGGLGLIFGSDAAIHAWLWQRGGERYRERWRALVWYFEGQGPAEMLAGGVLAAAEEMFFRGVLLRGLLAYGLPPLFAVGLVAVLFAGLHDLETRELRLFTVWAIWEGVLLGAIFLASRSLPAVMIVHGLHDLIGFALFAAVRARPLPSPVKR
jgi:membrane protease YdiL (CAAX protease family)